MNKRKYYKFDEVTGLDIKDKFGEHTCESDIEYGYKFSMFDLKKAY